MTPEIEAYWRKHLTKLVDILGVDEAREVAAEVVRRMGPGGTTRQWTATLLHVLNERYPGSVHDFAGLDKPKP